MAEIFTDDQPEADGSNRAYWLRHARGRNGSDFDETIVWADGIDRYMDEDPPDWQRSVLPIPSAERIAALEEVAAAAVERKRLYAVGLQIMNEVRRRQSLQRRPESTRERAPGRRDRERRALRRRPRAAGGMQVSAQDDICGLCGHPGADKMARWTGGGIYWPGEQRPEAEIVHQECEQAETARAHAVLSQDRRDAVIAAVRREYSHE